VTPREIAAGVFYLALRGANVYFVSSGSSWTLIDTAWPKSGPAIRAAAEGLFGADARPAAIMLTHAHPDHVGSAAELARAWGLPIHLHGDDLPLITRAGRARQDLMDPAGRYAQALMRLLPRRTRERMTSSGLEGAARAFSAEGSVPSLSDWECVPTPGHSAGHVVFFRRSDRVLIAGDAVLTVPLWGLLPSVQRISPPPRIASWNWRMTKGSVAILARLEPLVLATGHGIPMAGADLARGLYAFADSFSQTIGS
jgi:glyoxylase-like metal-dependent hydrolase (beta-lactamase superfamily II)